MGRDLLGLPGLARSSLALAGGRLLAWSFEDDSRKPTVLEQLWGASALYQLHAELTRGFLGIEPHAWLGYSSGETNALLALGDVDRRRRVDRERELGNLHARPRRDVRRDRERPGAARSAGRPSPSSPPSTT